MTKPFGCRGCKSNQLFQRGWHKADVRYFLALYQRHEFVRADKLFIRGDYQCQAGEQRWKQSCHRKTKIQRDVEDTYRPVTQRRPVMDQLAMRVNNTFRYSG